jgi:hypothetical protein
MWLGLGLVLLAAAAAIAFDGRFQWFRSPTLWVYVAVSLAIVGVALWLKRA